jgi:hypothetical protein
MPKTRPKARAVPVTKRALLQRINRKLVEEGEVLKTARGEIAQNDLGTFYVLDINKNTVAAHDVDPETLGRKLGVLRPWEHIVDKE